jgi:hypothetical protein
MSECKNGFVGQKKIADCLKGFFTMNWPTYYPESCPPQDSLETDGQVYRLVSADGPAENDFLPYWIKCPQRREEFQVKNQVCESCGLSVYRSLEDIKRLQRRIRHLPEKIGVANLDHSKGRIKRTFGKTHYTWWVPVSVEDPANLFKIVA